jgi:NAD(P)-dependent dehydrogenase (short-subunit alcohol dehydrogenase family)
MEIPERIDAVHVQGAGGGTVEEQQHSPPREENTVQDLQDRTVVVVGGGSGIGRALALATARAGAEVVVAGRDVHRLRAGLGDLGPRARAVGVDLADEDSVRRFAAEVGDLDHLVSTATAAANGPVASLDADAVQRAFAAKVIGPLLLAKHLGTRFRDGGSLLLFSGVLAWRPAPERAVTATTNGAVAALAQALAVELAPLRVNAVSPGIVDSGAWDGLGEGKAAFLDSVARGNPARRVGSLDDLVQASLLALTNPFVTGTTLHVDGGGRLA